MNNFNSILPNSQSRILLTALITTVTIGACCCLASGMDNPGPIKVEIRKENGQFRLYRGGQPYFIKGAVYQGDPNGKFPMKDLAARGANSARCCFPASGKILDEAQRLGMTVLMNLPMRMESVHKFNYGDPEAVRGQFEEVKKLVMEFKDHPAVLMWR